MREVTKTGGTREKVDPQGQVACALHARRGPAAPSGELRALDDRERPDPPCATCREIDRMVRAGEVPF